MGGARRGRRRGGADGYSETMSSAPEKNTPTAAPGTGPSEGGADAAAPIRVAIVDDQPMVREGFSAILAAQPDMEVVGTAADGFQAVRLAQSSPLDVILMDIRMPQMDGLEAMRRIFAEHGADADAPRIIILTTFDADDYVFTALRDGASGFLLKDAAVPELLNAVRVVHEGGALLAPSITQRVIADYAADPERKWTPSDDSGQPRSDAAAAYDTLTEREQGVLQLIAAGRSNAEIGAELFLAEPTVKTHVSRILQKLDLRDRTQIVVFAYENGLVRSAGR